MKSLSNPDDIEGGTKDIDVFCTPCLEFEIELCSILVDECDLIGHAFIAIDDVREDGSTSGEKIVRGFYPANDGDLRSIFLRLILAIKLH